jgi:CRP-like cAMP-binding protein
MREESVVAAADPGGIAELIARRKWSAAVDALRSRLFDGRVPSVQGRLQLADLMVSAGRDKEAVPILLGLADELVSEQSLAKAVAVLKRVDRIEPGRGDVQRRLVELARTQSAFTPEHAGAPGMPASHGASSGAPIGSESPAPAQNRAPSPAGDAKSSPELGQSDEHLRGVLREFLGLDVGDVTLPLGRRLRGADGLAAGADGVPPVAPGPPADALGTGTIAAVESVPDVGVEEEILDLVADVLRQPIQEQTEGDAPQSEAARVTRLLAVPLFAGLSAAELLAVVQGLALRTFEPGDVLVTEGEQGRSLFVLTSGRARVFVRSRDGHAVEVGRLEEGDFFGEIAALSGARRGATVTAAKACEVLELEKGTLDTIALAHPRVRATIEATYLARAGNATVAGVRDAELGARRAPARAVEVLEARFGEGNWDPRMRLSLADALLRSGKQDEAVPVLVGLADELARHGRIAKAIALVKKVERIQNRHVEELLLAPLHPAAPRAPQEAAGGATEREETTGMTHPFERWLLRLAREGLGRRTGAGVTGGAASPPAAYRPGLRASPLFEDFAEDDLLSLMAGLRLVSRQAGDIIVSEGEAGEGLFVLAAGAVKVMVCDQSGRSVSVCRLEEGAFFGEIATLAGTPRSATVVAAAPCELLELDRKALDEIATEHPRVREVLQRAHAARASDPLAERLRAR